MSLFSSMKFWMWVVSINLNTYSVLKKKPSEDCPFNNSSYPNFTGGAEMTSIELIAHSMLIVGAALLKPRH
jgi:hypothetical protein